MKGLIMNTLSKARLVIEGFITRNHNLQERQERKVLELMWT